MPNIKLYTIWDELAESDILIEYMRRINISNFDNNPLNETLFSALYNYSSETIPEVEEYFIRKYILSLDKFLNKANEIKKQYSNNEA